MGSPSTNSKFSLGRTILLNLFAWVVLIAGMILFSIYRACVDAILKIKLGRNYRGLFDRKDIPLCVCNASKLCIAIVLYIKSDRKIDIMQSLRNVLQKQIFDHPDLYPKLTDSRSDFGGYPYWIKNGCKLNDVLRPLKVPNNVIFDEDYLKEITGKIVSSEYDKNGSILWEVHANEEPLNCDNNETCYCYPVILRFHHCIADGTSLVALFIRVFGDETIENYGDTIFKKVGTSKSLKQEGKKLTIDNVKLHLAQIKSKLQFWLDLIFLSLGRYVEWNHFTPLDDNILHPIKYGKDKCAVWATEERVECVPMVKKIKNRINTHFTGVICTAMAASITNYFRKHPQPVPDHITGLLTSILHYTPTNQYEPIKLLNKATVCFFELPTIDESENNLLQALGQVTKMMSKHITLADVLITRLMIGFIGGFFPPKLFSAFIGYDDETFVLTNVPGVAKVKVLGGCTLEKMVPIAPNITAVGVTFAIVTYDDRLQIGLLVDKILMKSRPQIQRIADDVLRYIRLMNAECKQKWDDY